MPPGDRFSRPTSNESIQDRLRSVLDGVTQAEVAQRTGTAQSNVSRYLRDRRIPAEFCARICDVYGVSARWLLTGEGAPSGHDPDPR